MPMTATHSAPSDAGRLAGPYVGLSFYTEADAPLFFGRDAERQVIMGNLRAARLTLLYAESGVGKSSLLRAGVASRLRELAQHTFSDGGSTCYVPVVFSSWKDDPVDELIGEIEGTANSLLGVDSQVELPRDSLRSAIEGAVLALDRAAARDGSDRPAFTLLIILDQFEEYFLYGSREARAGRLADELADCVSRADLGANFLISIREDAYSALGDLLKGRMSNVYGNYLHLEYLDADAARDAIEKPVERYNSERNGGERVTIEPGLVETVLAQVRREPDGEQGPTNGNAPAPVSIRQHAEIVTPYLQLVMATLWERELSQGSRVLRLSTLEQLHGAEEIVGSHLDNALKRLEARDREIAIDVLHHLVTPSGAKIALEVGDLAAYTDHPPERIAAVMNKLAGAARILREVPPAPGKPADEDAYRRFEIYHDVLAGPINDAVSASATRRLQREKQAAEERARRERRRARVFRALAAVSSALLLVAVAAVALATVEGNRARRAQRAALSRQLAGRAVADFQGGALARGVLFSLEAYRTARTADARTSVVRALEATRGMVGYMSGHTGPVSSVAFSPDGKELASGSDDHTVIVWDAKTSRPVAVLRGSTAVASVAFSPDGSMLASAGADGTVILWNPLTGRRLRALRGGAASAESVAFSPDGKLLASGSDDRTVVLWDAKTAQRVRTLRGHTGAVYDVAFSPDGRVLASAGADHLVILWDASTGRRLRTLRGHTGAVSSVAFSPRAGTLASASDDRTVILWSVRTGGMLKVLRGHADAVQSVAFSPDGATLGSGSNDDTAIVWDARTGRPLSILSGHYDAVSTVAFSPDGGILATGSDDHSVILWNARPDHVLRTLIGHRGFVLGVAFSPDGRLIASAGDRTVVLWDAVSGQRLRTLRGHAAIVQSVAFTPDGHTLASGSNDHTVILWDVATGRRLRVLRGHSSYVYGVAFSPDGALLASASADHTVALWSVGTGQRLRTLRGHTNVVNAVAFSPDGRTLASASGDGSIILWQVATGQRVRTLSGDGGPVESVAFSPDGKTLASGGDDHALILWSAENGRRLGDPLVGHQEMVISVAFSPDGKKIASASSDGTVIVWNVATRLGQPLGGHTDTVQSVAFSPGGQMLASGSRDGVVLSGIPPASGDPDAIYRHLCSVVRRNLTRAEWHQFIPDQPYRRTCSDSR